MGGEAASPCELTWHDATSARRFLRCFPSQVCFELLSSNYRTIAAGPRAGVGTSSASGILTGRLSPSGQAASESSNALLRRVFAAGDSRSIPHWQGA
jgi:hypothetical protein